MNRWLVLALPLGLLVGCSSSGHIAAGDGGPGPGPGGLDGNKRLVDLTPDEAARLCDDLAGRMGGYGGKKAVPCKGGTVSVDAPKSQASCVADMQRFPPTCAATVNQTESCLGVLLDGSYCGGGAPPVECGPLFDSSCGSSTTGSGGAPGTPTPGG